jgi:hypothetical protein
LPSPRERPVHVLLTAAAVGLALAEAHPLLVMATAVVPFALLARLRAARLGAVAGVVVLGGGLAGELRLAAIDGAAERIRDGEHVNVRGHLLSAPRSGRFGASA